MISDGRFFKTAAEAHEWLAFDANDDDLDKSDYDKSDHFGEWQLWRETAERLDPWPLERIRSIDQKRHLRYELVCSIGVVPGAENVTAGRGFTDDLALAIWHAEHSEDPGWDVYDHLEQKHVAGGPPLEYQVRTQIEHLILLLTTRWFNTYPYLPISGDESSVKQRAKHEAAHKERYPDWEPTSEYIVAPLRHALYRAVGIERAAAESDPPLGQMAIYPDGRDLVVDDNVMEDVK